MMQEKKGQDKDKKKVIIFGGGVAALAAAAALVESNQKNTVQFDIYIITQAHRWGGRASSWFGGKNGPHLDLRYWPRDIVLDHGFHIIFHPSTYKNFWHTFSIPWKDKNSDGYDELRKRLCSNRRDFLCYEKNLVRLNYKEGILNYIKNVWEMWFRGGWSICEILSFYRVVIMEVKRYKTFEELEQVNRYAAEEFVQWCLKRGLKASVLNKQLFKFIADAPYVSPFKYDAASALRACWVFLRDCDAAEFSYIDGGITQELMDPLAEHLKKNHVQSSRWTKLIKLSQGVSKDKKDKCIVAYEVEKVGYHPDSSKEEEIPLGNVKGHSHGHNDNEEDSHRHHDHEEGMPAHDHPDNVSEFNPKSGEFNNFDYCISTLPLECLWEVLETSNIADSFPNLEQLMDKEKFPRPVATMNLQAWFQGRVIPREIDNVVAGLEPPCVMIDYKNMLKTYEDDKKWPGSVLEINGSAKELEQAYPDIVPTLGQPCDNATIEFAKKIMMDIAKKYNFPALEKAVKDETFLERDDWSGRSPWKGKKIPPFLWINKHMHNKFFVAAPNTLKYRPEIKTDYSNFFLAGDWTKNGFDCPCMEGAARSGRLAAREIQNGASCKNLIEVYDPD